MEFGLPHSTRLLMSFLAIPLVLLFLQEPAFCKRAKVLLLHSYHQGFVWTESLQDGFVDELEKRIDIEYSTEYLDAKSIAGTVWEKLIFQRLQLRYALNKPDIIIASDNAAVSFLLKYKASLFGNIPVVFCGLNGYLHGMFAHKHDYTGVIEKLPMRETVELASQLHKNAKEVVLFHDDTPMGRLLREKAIDSIIGTGLNARVLEAGTMEEQIASIQDLKQGSIILFLSYSEDAAGKRYSWKEIASLLERNAMVPVYSTYLEFIGYGAGVGGKLVSARQMGAQTAKMAHLVLQGRSPKDIPLEYTKSQWGFDPVLLRQWNIPKSSLPTGSVVLGEEIFNWQQDTAVYIYITVVILIGALGCGVLLLVSALRRGRRELQLYRMVFERSGEAIYVVDPRSMRFVDANAVAHESLGMSRDELLSIGPDAITPEFTTEALQKLVRLVGEPDGIAHLDTVHRRSDGTEFPVEVLLRTLKTARGADLIVAVVRDITREKKVGKALQQSENLFRTVIDQFPSVTEVYGMDGLLQKVNSAWERSFGMSSDQFVGSYNILDDPQIKNSNVFPLVLGAFSGETHEIEHWEYGGSLLGMTDGKKYLHAQLYPIRNVKGEQVNVAISFLDITERKYAKEKLEQSEKRFKALFNQTFQFMGLLTPEGVIEEVNDSAMELALNEPANILGKRIWECVWWTSSQPAREQIKDAVLGAGSGEVERFQTLYRTAGGQRSFMDVTFKPVRDSNGYITNIVFEGRDITDIRLAMDEVRTLRNRLHNVIDSMPSAVIGVDIHGRVNLWNNGAYVLTGLSADRAVGQMLHEVCPLGKGDIDEVLDAVMESKPMARTKVSSGSGEDVVHLDYSVYPVQGEGDDGAVIRFDDVSERVRIEQMMIQSEKMMSVGGLAAGMAHEINNPLGGVLQGVQNILRRLSPELEANKAVARKHDISIEGLNGYLEERKVLYFIQGIKDSGLRAADIISKMLEFSRRSEASSKSCNLNRLVDNAIELASSDYDMSTNYDFNHVRVLKDYDPAVPKIKCVETELEQVILNLLRNAAQAMAGADMEGRRPTIIVRTHARGSIVVVEIEDNGPGLDESIRKRVFEPFFTTKEAGAGAGLGLSVSYFIITQHHGGELVVESQLGSMTRFTIRLPVDPEAVA